ncbi:ABC transporter permease/M1 family aminopeptidase [Flocculibacter collagenilyticus]|uniref:ABC transporter permease/M1 family aminopeptidase n=1 Tax=Flocculibacter collagenilyticus TaxID=2744479 RepID=UPI0018F362AC|nr:M1 family aminopeptidase [Flocculibacter collagenilyticus]
MFAKMFAFEWRYYLRQPSFYVTCLIFFLLPFLATVSENIQIGGGGNVLYNGSFAITQTMLILGLFSMFLVINFVANTATRNDTSQMAEIIYSKPINAFSYQLGRFFGTYFITVLVFAMVPLGIMLGCAMPWVDAERVGPTNLAFYGTTFFYFTMPTLFVLACLFYSAAVRFRSLMAVYLAAVALFILYIATGSLLDDPQYRTLSALSDPFGLRTFADISRYWTVHERNTQVIELSGVLLQNRLIWIAFGVVVLAVFGSLHHIQIHKPSAKKSKKQLKLEKVIPPFGNNIAVKGNNAASWGKFISRTQFEIKQVVFSAPFYILLIFSAFNMVMMFINFTGMYGTPNWPLTQTMVEQVNGAFSLMLIVVVTYYSGEVVWRERNSGMGDIIDATPVFNIAFWLSKLVAVCLVICSLLMVGMLISIGYQFAMGYQNIDLAQYLISILYFFALPMCLLAVLSFFIQVLSPNKFVGMLIFVGYIFANMAFDQIGLEHNLVDYAGAPSMTYSDMNGYGIFLEIHSWYMLYWTAIAVMLSTLGYALWQRGPQTSLKARLALMSYQMGTMGKATVASALLVAVLSGGYIYYNTTVLNQFIGQDELETRQVDYEKKYVQFEHDEIPVITKVNATVDLSPYQRSLTASANVEVVNKSSQPIKRFLVNIPQHSSSWQVELAGGAVTEIDERYNTAWFEFELPLQPNETRTGTLSVARQHQGFKDRDFDVQLVENGTFINNFELFPSFGFNRSFILMDRHKRKSHDLAPRDRANKLEDEAFHNESFFGKGTDFIDFEATVSTAEDQVAIAPGYLQKEWTENGKRYFHYKMDSPMAHFYAFLSARFEVKQDQHDGVNIEVYYHPEHNKNVDVMIESVKDSLDYFGREFSPYQHKQMRIIEFPRYRGFAQSFANTVPYSEDIGFIADLRDPEDINMVYYVTAHEMAHQWWGHQVGAANVQGSAIISETLSQYSAVMVLEKKYGPEKLRKFLKYELDRYLSGRTSEQIGEQPMLRAENQQYIHYRKGSVIMASLRDRLGEAHVNQALKGFLQTYQYQSTPYPTTLDLVAALKANATAEEQAFITSLFEDITLYDLKAEKVEVADTGSNSQTVTLTVQAKRVTSDSKGMETDVPLSEMVDVVLFSADPESLKATDTVIYNEKHLIKSGENVITIELPKNEKKLPKFAGIDPFVKLVDRDSADNIIKL